MSKFMALFGALLAVLNLALALASPGNVFYWLTAAGWSIVAAIWWRQHVITRRALTDFSTNQTGDHE